MKTINIHSQDEASQGPFVTINVADFDPAVHEPFSEEDAQILRSSKLDELAPQLAEDVNIALDAKFNEISDEQKRLAALSEELESEHTRLTDWAAALEVERVKLEADRAALTAPAEQAGAELTATEIKAELTKRGIEFRGNASKADLQALLDDAIAKDQP